MVKSSAEGHDVGGHGQFVLLVPGTASEFFRLYAEENGEIQESQLACKVFRWYFEYVKNSTTIIFPTM